MVKAVPSAGMGNKKNSYEQVVIMINFLGGQMFLKFWPSSLAEPAVNKNENFNNSDTNEG